MSDKLRFLPTTVPIVFQIPGKDGRHVTLHTAHSAHKLVIESEDGKRRNIMHYYAWYMKHVAHCSFVFITTDDLLQYCLVADGFSEKQDLLKVLKRGDNLGKVGIVDPRVKVVKRFLEAIETAEGSDDKAAVATKLFTFLQHDGLDMATDNPAFKVVALAKCEEMRRNHRTFRALFKSATDLIVALGEEPVELPSEETCVMTIWRRSEPMAVKLQIGLAPAEEAILSRDATVWTPERSKNLYQFFNSYCKRHNIPQREHNLLRILQSLILSNGVSVYEQCLSGHYPPELNRHDEEKRLRGSCDCTPCSQARIGALEKELATCKAKLAAIAKLL